MKKIIVLLVMFAFMLGVTGCKKGNSAALEFKKEYEALNGVVNKNGKEHRTITISEDNPYIKVTPEEIVKKIINKETFYLYVGDPLCPWCRSVLEKSIEVSKKNNISEIYYIEIWDDEGKEILRDKYELVNGVLSKTIEGTDVYRKLLVYFDALLNDYTISDADGQKIETGEKRIYAPNFFYIEDGIAKKMVEGISEKQTDSREVLTEEMLKDEETIFEGFFSNSCSLNGC